MNDAETARISCLASNNAWRREATELRALARGQHLTEAQREQLRREAEAAERQADWWLSGAIEAR
jgi:hypothetical protein